MNLYISDTHFGHANVMQYDQRPFSSVDKMDECMIDFWNTKVNPDDDVWFLGDLCYKNGKPVEWYLKQLSGKKHLIVGNHDLVILKNPKALSYFESVDQIKEITDTYQDKSVQIILCHYPILQWAHKHRNAWHIYGHIHTDTGEAYEIMSRFEHAFNAAAAINHYVPVSLQELVQNNRDFQERVNTHKIFNDKYARKEARVRGEDPHKESDGNMDGSNTYIGMKTTQQTVKKLTYEDNEFYVIDGYLYYHDAYGLSVISAENQTVGTKKYSTEEYIVKDPNQAILATKSAHDEWDQDCE